MKVKIIVLLVVVLAVNASRFNIMSQSVCNQQSENGNCIKWVQNGTVEEDYGSCFPSDAKVMTYGEGIVEMKDLKVGQMVLAQNNECYDCPPIYSEVVGWFHKDSDVEYDYLEIKTGETGTFYTSAYHNIAIQDGKYVFAKDLEGINLFSNKRNKNVGSVKEINTQTKQGMYAPKTRSGNYYIMLNFEAHILAHNYAHIKDPVNYETMVDFMFNTYEYLYGKPADIDEAHPVANWMTTKFSFITEGIKK